MISVMKNIIRKAIQKYYRSKDIIPVTLHNILNSRHYTLINEIKTEGKLMLLEQEAFLIASLVEKTNKISGDAAEVGVFTGGSAKLIRENTDKKLHLFDTFDGLPDVSSFDNSKQFKEGEYSASLDSVRDYLSKYSSIYFYKGLLQDTSHNVKDKRFSIVHFDVDLYESTKSCIEFFYPRMNTGGVIISHDYTTAPGVRKAFDEFFADKKEIVLEMYTTNQCYVIKCCND